MRTLQQLLRLNIKDRGTVTFNRGTVIQTSYEISKIVLENVSSFCDLGITLDSKLNFNLHIDACVSKSSSVLGFIKRWSREFDDPYLMKLEQRYFTFPWVKHTILSKHF